MSFPGCAAGDRHDRGYRRHSMGQRGQDCDEGAVYRIVPRVSLLDFKQGQGFPLNS
jgi:hypothetical protein